jgi:hypothetical protein
VVDNDSEISKKMPVVNNSVKILLSRYKRLSHMEKPRYLTHAVLVHIFRSDIDLSFKPVIDKSYLEATFEKVRAQIINNDKIVPDDYCIDMHVKNVKRDAKERHFFRNIGAHVNNECEKFKFEFYLKYYEDFYN